MEGYAFLTTDASVIPVYYIRTWNILFWNDANLVKYTISEWQFYILMSITQRKDFRLKDSENLNVEWILLQNIVEKSYTSKMFSAGFFSN